MGGYAEWPPRNPPPREEAPRRSYRFDEPDPEVENLRAENERLRTENARLRAENARLKRKDPVVAKDDVGDDGVSDTEKRFKLIEPYEETKR